MQLHALSLAEAGWFVTLVGIHEHAPYPQIAKHPTIRHLALSTTRRRSSAFWFSTFRLYFGVSLQLLWLLVWRLSTRKVLLIQHPPSVPTAIICWIAQLIQKIVCRRRSLWIIDWHNLGFTRLALRLGDSHQLVRLYRWSEGFFSRKADVHLCVSQALSGVLSTDFDILDTHILYDRPSKHIHAHTDSAPSPALSGLLTNENTSSIPRILVSATSWTTDEDLDMLLNAAQHADKQLQQASPGSFHPLRLLITGQGRLRAAFEQKVAAHPWRHISIQTTWLSGDDYIYLLHAADFGICMHTSSSGIDIPMKLADMLGARLPVLTYDYGATLSERFQDGRHGVLFKDASTLAALLLALAQPNWEATFASVLDFADRAQTELWETHWQQTVVPLLTPVS